MWRRLVVLDGANQYRLIPIVDREGQGKGLSKSQLGDNPVNPIGTHLAEHMAGRQCHEVQGGRVPCGEEDAAVVWVGLEGVDDLG